MNLSQIRDLARSKADEQTTNFIGDSELNNYINQGQRHIFTKIVQRFENYFITKGTALNGGLITTVINQMSYDLPSDLHKFVRVEHRRSGSTDDNEWRKLATLNIASDRLDDYFPLREGYTPGFGYFVAGNQIHIKPVPTQAYEVRIWYVPNCTALSVDTDTPVIPEMYHELISEYAAMQCLRKSGESIWTENKQMFELELSNLLETIEIRDQSPEQMTITDDIDFVRYYGV